MITCPDCKKPTKKHGEPVLHGHFLDQIIFCDCGWCNVITVIVDGDYHEPPKQLDMFSAMDERR
jgi:hypothetical protein